ncbi:PD-(D/E)XK motif protein [Acinetobacter sp. 256-1]|uniref:PD-(D/E)XK motif protein n=1 Tax=Acinetobacter sp. 256-1 TaxID=2746721 RepID=UPI002574C427|nr:PD-(D/E)XK motif protein [Acinetobacter sp. 256-1]MDM1757674.1 PD-(D/E)XK motif protein [Acinetobacter sp. 256-1]
MPVSLPWDELSVPTTKVFTTRRIGEYLKANVFIAKDQQNDFSVLVQHHEDLRHTFNKHRVDVGSVSSDYRELSKGFALQFKLKDEKLLEYFDQFIQFVLRDLDQKDHEQRVVEAFLIKLKNWKRFISTTQYGKLTPEKIRGLLAELHFLDSLFTAFPSEEESILQAWYGPKRLQHDFIFKDLAVEIKSISSVDKRSIRISSVNQLETNMSKLYLFVTAILEAPEHATDSVTLNSMVNKVKLKLDQQENVALLTIFEQKLLESNYLEDHYYDKYHYVMRPLHTYHVIEDFPKLDSGLIPKGISNVSYELDLNIIDQYKVGDFLDKVGLAL